MPDMGTLFDIDSHHQKPLEPFRTWARYTRHPDDNSSGHDDRAQLFGPRASMPSSQSERLCILKVSQGAEDSARPVSPESSPDTKPGQLQPLSQANDTRTASPGNTDSASHIESSLSLDPNDVSDVISSSMSKSSPPPPSPSTHSRKELAAPFDINSTSTPILIRPPKRRRAIHDVDGPGTGDLSCKKRRIRHHLITSRLSQPYSLPATHIINRESGEDTPMLSRFLKRLSTVTAQKAGHQTALVRKAAIMNRARLNLRQAALNRGHEDLWRLASGQRVFTHGVQLVTGASATGAMFPGRSDENISVPEMWRPHTTARTAAAAAERSPYLGTPPQPGPERWPPPESSHPGEVVALTPLSSRSGSTLSNTNSSTSSTDTSATSLRPPPAPRLTPQQRSPLTSPRLEPADSRLMTPMAVMEDDEDDDHGAFPASGMGGGGGDDDDIDDVYADFGALFGARVSANSENEQRAGDEDGAVRDEHYYEEYLDELDGIAWVV